MNDNTEELIIGETTWIIKRRLGWQEQARIDDYAGRLFTSGRALSDMENISELEEVEIRPDTVGQSTARLLARLVSVDDEFIKRNQIPKLDPAHVHYLIKRIIELEEEQEEEIKALQPGNPTEMLSPD